MLKYYRLMRTLSCGEAIFKYLEIILTLPMYSVHYFEVKVGPFGICISGDLYHNYAIYPYAIVSSVCHLYLW